MEFRPISGVAAVRRVRTSPPRAADTWTEQRVPEPYRQPGSAGRGINGADDAVLWPRFESPPVVSPHIAFRKS